MEINEYDEMYLSPSGGAGGSKGGTDAHVTQTQTNPVVPDDMKGIADALNAISGGMLGSPVNFGPTGLDAPKSGPLIPEGSMGNLYASPAFANGFNRRNVMGMGRFGGRGGPRMMQPRSYGDLFSMTRPGIGAPQSNGIPMGGSIPPPETRVG